MIVNSQYQEQYNTDTESKELMMKCVLSIRNYNKRGITEHKEKLVLTNGKSTIEITPKTSGIYSRYNFVEYFENKNVESKGFYLPEYLGESLLDEENYHMRKNYNGTEYYRQAFSYNNRQAIISFIIKKECNLHGLWTQYSIFSISLIISYYDSFNNEFIREKIDVDDLTDPYSKILNYIYPDKTETIQIIPDAYTDDHSTTDSRFYTKYAKEFKTEIRDALIYAYDQVEKYLGTKLETKDTLEIVNNNIRKLVMRKNNLKNLLNKKR